MSASSFDVIVVGARCAGASVATHLCRAGASVALLDASALPSDQPMSTHLVQPPGMDELDRLGVGNAVRRLSPAITAALFDLDDESMVMRYGSGRAAHCLRRDRLDGLLQEAAIAAGADLQPQSRVVGLLRRDDGRVCGVQVRRRDGRIDSVRSRLVIGADGRASMVARLAGAREYLGYEGPRAACWAYWPRPSQWDPSLLYNGSHGDASHILFPTAEDQVLIATSPPAEHADRWRGARETAYRSDVLSCTRLSEVLRDSRPLSRVRCLARTRYFFRAAAGPGWALAGDAGHHKEFFVGFGITDALRDGRALAAAVVADTDAALARYWRRRDVERIGMYRWGQELGRADSVSALERLVARRVGELGSLGDRFGSVIDGQLAPHALFPARRVLAWALADLRGGDASALALVPGRAASTLRNRAEAAYRRTLLWTSQASDLAGARGWKWPSRAVSSAPDADACPPDTAPPLLRS
ncbi:MAG TPA: NAD(P)/FAD-dependent oxidoreductase [Candidatus Limnocylindrales bacterium]|nr:NAD(P)/FAD-dependent oxidoreductase [Candidatus Limnocylindrales bacterium]